jgi:hypothetical protein
MGNQMPPRRYLGCTDEEEAVWLGMGGRMMISYCLEYGSGKAIDFLDFE